MIRSTKSALVALAMTASALALTAGPAVAVTDFRNCDHLHNTYRYGVARSDAAADRQQRTDHHRPAVKPKVYRANNESDADNDGTACEVSN